MTEDGRIILGFICLGLSIYSFRTSLFRYEYEGDGAGRLYIELITDILNIIFISNSF